MPAGILERRDHINPQRLCASASEPESESDEKASTTIRIVAGPHPGHPAIVETRIAKNDLRIRFAIAQKGKAFGIPGDTDNVSIDFIIIELVRGLHQAGNRARAKADHGGANRPFLLVLAQRF